jgi:hypothetical protein
VPILAREPSTFPIEQHCSVVHAQCHADLMRRTVGWHLHNYRGGRAPRDIGDQRLLPVRVLGIADVLIGIEPSTCSGLPAAAECLFRTCHRNSSGDGVWLISSAWTRVVRSAASATRCSIERRWSACIPPCGATAPWPGPQRIYRLALRELIEQRHDNLRAALGWCMAERRETDGPATGHHAVSVLDLVWCGRVACVWRSP